MLGKRSAQQGMFEADTLYGEFVGQRTFYGYLASQRYELFRDADFAELYAGQWTTECAAEPAGDSAGVANLRRRV